MLLIFGLHRLIYIGPPKWINILSSGANVSFVVILITDQKHRNKFKILVDHRTPRNEMIQSSLIRNVLSWIYQSNYIDYRCNNTILLKFKVLTFIEA